MCGVCERMLAVEGGRNSASRHVSPPPPPTETGSSDDTQALSRVVDAFAGLTERARLANDLQRAVHSPDWVSELSNENVRVQVNTRTLAWARALTVRFCAKRRTGSTSSWTTRPLSSPASAGTCTTRRACLWA